MSAPFVTGVGVRAETVRVAGATNPDSTDNLLTIKVRGAEVWDAVRVEAIASAAVRDVKHAALAVLMPDVDMPDGFVVKLHGAEIGNENLSLREAGVKDGATLLVMSRRRRAVR